MTSFFGALAAAECAPLGASQDSLSGGEERSVGAHPAHDDALRREWRRGVDRVTSKLVKRNLGADKRRTCPPVKSRRSRPMNATPGCASVPGFPVSRDRLVMAGIAVLRAVGLHVELAIL